MGELLYAAFGFPSLSFSAAVVAVAVFWLLVLFRAVECDGCYGAVDTEALHLGPVPGSVAASLFIVGSWILSMSGFVVLRLAGAFRSFSALLPLTLPVLAPVVSSWTTRRLAGPLVQSADEPGPHREDLTHRAEFLERDRLAAVGRRALPAPARRRR
ncbi:hypothetical protein [Streptomyces sp. ALB3]|uniref:hypothetical protein n=1 Tax=Streptomyces sp. ALB3 TaxID=3374278 RepID=UPI00378745F2